MLRTGKNGERKMGKRGSANARALSILLAFVCLLGWATPAFAGPAAASDKGEIVYLNVTGAASPGDPINISSQVHAFQKIQNSNMFYEVYSPSMVLVDTREIDPGKLEIDDTYNDSWNSSNTPETGNYTITLCWSTGNSHNCDIDYVETVVYSVPTFGYGLTLAALVLLVLFLWQNRRLFQEVRA